MQNEQWTMSPPVFQEIFGGAGHGQGDSSHGTNQLVHQPFGSEPSCAAERWAWGTAQGRVLSRQQQSFSLRKLFSFSLFSSPFFLFFQLFFNYTTHEHTRTLKFSHVVHKPAQCQSLPKGSRSQQFGTHPSRLWSLHLHADSFLTHTMDPHPLVERKGKCGRNGSQSYQPPSSSSSQRPYCISFLHPPIECTFTDLHHLSNLSLRTCVPYCPR